MGIRKSFNRTERGVALLVLVFLTCCSSTLAKEGKLTATVSVTNVKSRHLLTLQPADKVVGKKRSPSTYLENQPTVAFYVGDGELAVDKSSPFNENLQLGEQNLGFHNLPVAEQKFRQALQVASKTEKTESSRALLGLGMVQLLKNKPVEADKLLNEAALGFVGSPKDLYLGRTFFQIGLSAYKQKKFLWAAESFQQSVFALESVPDGKHWVPQTLTYLANCLYELDRFKQADEVYRQAQAKAKQDSELDSLLETIADNRALCAETQGNYKGTEERLLEQIAIAKKNGISEELSAVDQLCRFYERRKRIPDAIKRYEAILPALKALPEGCRTQKGDLLEYLGWYYFSESKFDQSANRYQQAMELYNSLKEPHMSSRARMQLADVLCNKDQWKKAIPLYEQSLQYQAKTEGVSSTETFLPRSRLARCYAHVGEPAKAEALLQQNLKFAKTPAWKASVHCSIGHLYRIRKDWDKARRSYDAAIAEYKKDKEDLAENIAAVNKFIEKASHQQVD
jgi:tetratricopeptide (TPR) repeat protein